MDGLSRLEYLPPKSCRRMDGRPSSREADVRRLRKKGLFAWYFFFLSVVDGSASLATRTPESRRRGMLGPDPRTTNSFLSRTPQFRKSDSETRARSEKVAFRGDISTTERNEFSATRSKTIRSLVLPRVESEIVGREFSRGSKKRRSRLVFFFFFALTNEMETVLGLGASRD